MNQRFVYVTDTSYSVIERHGYIKADLKGLMGWTSVWAPTNVEHPYTLLVRRIKQARMGVQ